MQHPCQGLANLILDKPEQLDHNTRKLVRLLRPDFEEAAASGTCGPNLWAFAMSLRAYMKADVQNCEGMNSLIRSINERCKNIGLPLLSARCVMKRALGVGARGACSKWTSLLPRVSHVMEMLKSAYHRGKLLTEFVILFFVSICIVSL